MLKSINGHLRAAELEQAADGRGRAAGHRRSLTGYYSAEEKNALLGACDCYVSLHRAEGLGLTLAEAMALGKPVDRHRILRQPAFHDAGQQLSRRLHAVGRPPFVRARILSARGGRRPISITPLGSCARFTTDRPTRRARRAAGGQTSSSATDAGVAGAALARRVEEIHRDAQAQSRRAPTRLTTPGSERRRPAEPVTSTSKRWCPSLQHLGTPRPSAEGRPWPSARLAAQRAFFRLIRPYLVSAATVPGRIDPSTFVSSIRTLSEEVAVLKEADRRVAGPPPMSTWRSSPQRRVQTQVIPRRALRGVIHRVVHRWSKAVSSNERQTGNDATRI